MTRRHEQLIPLTHDHHHALEQARQPGLAAESKGPAVPATCPHCGQVAEDAPVDAGARGETGSAEMICTACGRIIRLDADGQAADPTNRA
jgi:predicted RNA-binding Zn-ribbon protein involved in translation (DUF1610 family)